MCISETRQSRNRSHTLGSLVFAFTKRFLLDLKRYFIFVSPVAVVALVLVVGLAHETQADITYNYVGPPFNDMGHCPANMPDCPTTCPNGRVSLSITFNVPPEEVGGVYLASNIVSLTANAPGSTFTCSGEECSHHATARGGLNVGSYLNVDLHSGKVTQWSYYITFKTPDNLCDKLISSKESMDFATIYCPTPDFIPYVSGSCASTWGTVYSLLPNSNNSWTTGTPPPAPVIYFHDIDDLSKVKGAVADGESRILVKIVNIEEKTCPNPEDSTISEGDGSWDSGWSLKNGNCERIYKAPFSYVRNGHSEDPKEGYRIIKLTIKYNGQEIPHDPLYLFKPPVVLIHGLWDDMKTWADLKSKLEGSGFFFVYANSYPNSLSFSKNCWVVLQFVVNALDLPKKLNIVAKKVDIVAHSMGGLLTKLYGNESYIRTITTIGTPHYGSPLADYLWMAVDNADSSPLKKWFANGLKKLKHSATDGAIFDLRVNGGIHCIAKKIMVPNNVIVGISSSTNQTAILFINFLSNVFKFPGLLPFIPYVPNMNQVIFGVERNDWIVSESSQEGGATGNVDYVNWHCDEPKDKEIEDKIVNFLNATNYSSYMQDQRIEMKNDLSESILPQEKRLKSTTGFIQITNPTNGQNFSSGDIVTVTLNTSQSNNMLLLYTSTLESAFFEHGPYEFQFSIPNNWVGPLTIMAGAQNSDGYIGVVEVTVNVTTIAKVTDIEVSPQDNPLMMNLGSSIPFHIDGVYDDGIERIITSSAVGTSYDSSNPKIVEISQDGTVTAKALGESLLTIANSGISKEIRVIVKVPPPLTIYLPLILK